MRVDFGQIVGCSSNSFMSDCSVAFAAFAPHPSLAVSAINGFVKGRAGWWIDATTHVLQSQDSNFARKLPEAMLCGQLLQRMWSWT